MAKTNYNKMSNKNQEDVMPVVETTSLDAEPTVKETVAEEVVVEKKPEKKVKIGAVANCEKLNVRTEPSIDAAIALVITKGTKVEIVGSKGDFYNVRKDTGSEGFNGWCMKKYISVK